MFTVLVINSKGGCGKTTLATHLAAHYAGSGFATVLADTDRQRSSLGWLAHRPRQAALITGLDWVKDQEKVPAAAQRLVIDAAAALRFKDVEDLAGHADALLLPVLPSAFDEQATLRFLKKLRGLKAIEQGRLPLLLAANRVRPRTNAAAGLKAFLSEAGLPLAASLRDSQIYPDLAAQGLSLFDTQGRRAASLKEDWLPLFAALGEQTPLITTPHKAKRKG